MLGVWPPDARLLLLLLLPYSLPFPALCTFRVKSVREGVINRSSFTSSHTRNPKKCMSCHWPVHKTAHPNERFLNISARAGMHSIRSAHVRCAEVLPTRSFADKYRMIRQSVRVAASMIRRKDRLDCRRTRTAEPGSPQLRLLTQGLHVRKMRPGYPASLLRSRIERVVHHLLRFAQDCAQMRLALEALRVDLVDVLRA